MTSAQPMQMHSPSRTLAMRIVSPALLGKCCTALAAAFLFLFATGCGPKLHQPAILKAPYDHRQIWAVVPFSNESGVSSVDTLRFADLMAQQAQQVYGIDTVPVNRVIEAMRRLDLMSIDTPTKAMMLMNTLNVEGLIVGTITAYDPYPPPLLGAAAQLHLREIDDGRGRLNPQALVREPSERPAAGDFGPVNPVAQAAGVFDARNHQTLMWLEAYSAGRTEPDSAYGDEIYLVSMELYTQFVCHRLLHDLLATEQARVKPVEQEAAKR